VYISFFVLLSLIGYSQPFNDSPVDLSLPSQILFAENKGQWNEKVLYEGKFRGGKVFLEKNAFTYLFYPDEGLKTLQHRVQHDSSVTVGAFYHAVKMRFLNCVDQPNLLKEDSNAFYENYFLGKDPSKWAAHVKSYKKIEYSHLYPRIHLKCFSDRNNFRYDFRVDPGADPKQILMQFEGQNSLSILEEQLVIHTQGGNIMQRPPYAYQIVGGHQKKIQCSYILKNDLVSLKLGDYDRNLPLIIDPTLVFATYTGSLSDNFGMTATYDVHGNAYTAGVCFGPQYPLSLGAIQVNFMGVRDISVSKFDPLGFNLLYSSYLGGADTESPQSIVVNGNDELIVFGQTNSNDFPTTAGSFQHLYGGLSDFIISKFNSTGTTLSASTYLGGSFTDGVNSAFLKYNYSDNLRGSVIVDDSNYVYVTGCTFSGDFPVTSGCLQSSIGGTQDACFSKLKPNLSGLVFSSFLGGSGYDGIYNIALDESNNLYVTGGTESSNFPTTPNALHVATNGPVDGFVSRISKAGNVLIASTYLGTDAYDQCYFIQLDKQGKVYVYGQTEGLYPVTSGVYSNPNSGQFIHCLNPGLSSTLFSTVIGSGDGNPDIVPSAFLVDVCGNIYLSGWAGFNPTNGTTGLPVTSNAFLNVTDGRDFYFMVLNKNAASLQYATFFGGDMSHEHVDGGTSRFDKSGIIYQAICESCGGNDDMPATPSAWSTQNGSTNCNNAIVKFAFNANLTAANVSAPTKGCVPFSVSFINNSVNGLTYSWDFGDGTTSTAISPSHTYTNAGIYTVRLISKNVSTCNVSDTTYVTITVTSPPSFSSIQYNTSGCTPLFVDFINTNTVTASYHWNFGDGGMSSLAAPSHTFVGIGSYTVQLIVSTTGLCGAVDTLYSVIPVVSQLTLTTVPELTICKGDSVTLPLQSNLPNCSYTWSPSASLNHSNIQQPKASPILTTVYKVIAGANGCLDDDSVKVIVNQNGVKIIMDSLHTCMDDTVILKASHPCSGYNWSNGQNSSQINVINPGWYYLTTIENNCIATDSVRVDSFYHVPIPRLTYTLCSKDVTELIAPYGDFAYHWEPDYRIKGISEYNPKVDPLHNTTYSLTLANGPCLSYGLFSVTVLPLPSLTVSPRLVEVFSGEMVELNCLSDTICTWSSAYLLSCSFCNNPTATVESDITYYATVQNEFGCRARDSVDIRVTPTLYIPNSFSPNGDLINDVFKPEYTGFKEVELLIFDRWGALIFRTNELLGGWNGKYKEGNCELGVYIYKLNATDLYDRKVEKVGHVTLLR
jgi:gliding motility-associated-like protein